MNQSKINTLIFIIFNLIFLFYDRTTFWVFFIPTFTSLYTSTGCYVSDRKIYFQPSDPFTITAQIKYIYL